MSASVFRVAGTGAGPISDWLLVPTGQTYRVLSVMLNLNAAATTSENLTITLDAIEGAAYDTLLYSLDLAAGATTDLLWQPDAKLVIVGGDKLTVAWANTGGRTWGLLITAEAL